MSRKIQICCQWSKGRRVIGNLTSASAFIDLQEEIHKATGIVPSRQQILTGFPKKRLHGDVLKRLSALRIQSGDCLIVNEVDDNETAGNDDPVEIVTTKEVPAAKKREDDDGQMKRKIIKADNSCLFGSISFVLENHTMSRAAELRSLAADIIASDPFTYNETFLGRPNKDYCEWIRKKNSWGGTPELIVFSNMYETEIDVVNVQNLRIDEFGERKGYKKRVFLLHNGIHFDALYLTRNGKTVTVFSTDEEKVKGQALSLAGDLNDARQYTDLQGRLLCLVCSMSFKGQMAAYRHGQATGHTNFKET